jgi:hypothetical protein
MVREIQDPLLRRIHAILRDEVDPDFDFLSPGPSPWCPVDARRREAPVALITTSSIHLKGDVPFRTLEERFGDTSFRLIPRGTLPDMLDLDAPYVDRRYIPQDPEVALPLRALEEVHGEGRCGPPAARHVSVSGGIVRPLPGVGETAQAVAKIFREDGTGVVVLLPSCPLCIQTVCILARELESRGFPTVCVTLLPELSRIVGAPRSLAVRFPFGAPCGNPGNSALQRAVLSEALDLLFEAREGECLVASTLTWHRPPAQN